MAGEIKFRRDFAEFGSEVRPFERDDDVGYVVTELMFYEGYPYYPANALMDAKLSSTWLGDGEAMDEASLDLILRFEPSYPEAPDNYYFFEIVMRGDGFSYYGGFCDGSNLRVTDEVKNGHRVIETDFEGDVWRWVFTPGVGNGPGQYRFEQILGSSTANSVRRRGKRSR